MKNDSFICYCNNSTETECLQKMLFGYKGPVHHIPDAEAQSPKGFLYNYQKDELIGPFQAITSFKMNIVPTAFNGKYPFQVRVSPIGKPNRRSNAVAFFSKIGINVDMRQFRHHLPPPVITNDQQEKLIAWLQPDFVKAIDDIINDLIQLISNPMLILPLEVLRKSLKVQELSEGEADEFLKFLRDNVIKKEFPDNQDNLGILKRSSKHHLLEEKISNQASFDSLCSSLSLKYDVRQSKFLPLIFMIIKLIRLP